MNEKYIKSLIRLVEESEIESLEVSSWGRKVKITQKLDSNSNGHNLSGAIVQAPAAAQSPTSPPSEQVKPTEPAAPPADNISNLVEIKSPPSSRLLRVLGK